MLEYVRELSNPDPTRRRRAIIALGKIGNPTALKPLSEVYRSDPDPQLRDLARRAGVYIRELDPTSTPLTRPRVEPPEAQPARVATAEEITRARGYADEALSLNLRGDDARAVKALHKALNLNPALIEDTYFTGIAGTILKMSASEAIATLRDRDQRTELVKSTRREHKAKLVEDHLRTVEQVDWSAISIELIAYTLIVALGPVLMALIAAQGLQQALGSASAADAPEGMRSLADMYGALTSLPTLALLALTSAVGGLLNLMIQTGLIHVVARFALRGKGSFSFLLHKTVPLFIRYFLISFVVGAVAVGVGIGSGAVFLVYIGGIVLLLFSLYTLVKLAGRVGAAYNFGSGMGFVSILLAAVVLALLDVGMAALLSESLSSLLSRFVTPA